MDPAVCLRRAIDALRDGDINETLVLFESYRNWRRFGGFEPAGDDGTARTLTRAIRRNLKRRFRNHNHRED